MEFDLSLRLCMDLSIPFALPNQRKRCPASKVAGKS